MQQPYYNASVMGGESEKNNESPVVKGYAPPATQGMATATTLPVSTYDHGTSGGAGAPTRTHANDANDPNFKVSDGDWVKGEVQPKRCNDVFFAILFVAHLVLMGWAAATYAPYMAQDLVDNYEDYNGGGRNDDNNGGGGGERLLLNGEDKMMSSSTSFLPGVFVAVGRNIVRSTIGSTGPTSVRRLDDYNAEESEMEYNGTASTTDILTLVAFTGVAGAVISTLTLTFLVHFASFLLKAAIFFNIGVSVAIFCLGSYYNEPVIMVAGFAGFALTACYAYFVWDRIPFAAANLATAVTSVKANLGVTSFAYWSMVLMVGWSLWWGVAFLATVFVTSGCDAAQGQCEKKVNMTLLFLFFLSYFWTQQVIKNVVHVTVAGTVGTWWYTPAEASSFCSQGMWESHIRAMTYSFGSICFGSLLVAIIQAIKEMVRTARDSGDDNIILCCAECCLGCIENLAEYFNQWAFVFVGVYGYPFLEAAKNVINLFKTRGWTTIITDGLVDNVLFMVSVGNGFLVGILGVLIGQGMGIDFGDQSTSVGVSFFIGLVIGFVLTSVLMGVVGSAVNTVIVCYAEAPNEFQANHTELSNRMREAWRQAWPQEFKY